MPATNLILIRGNSGSGKSSVARALRAASVQRIMLVEQDYLRRTILKEKEREGADNLDLIEQTVRFGLERGYVVVLEGILHAPRYGAMLRRLIEAADRAGVFYMDVSLDETLRRHTTKPNAHEFGEAELREWYRKRDLLGIANEVIIPESSSLDESVKLIVERCMSDRQDTV